jgi:hypothetical protein
MDNQGLLKRVVFAAVNCGGRGMMRPRPNQEAAWDTSTAGTASTRQAKKHAFSGDCARMYTTGSSNW